MTKAPLGELCLVRKGTALTKKQTSPGDVPVVAGGRTSSYSHAVANRPAGVVTVSASGANAGFVNSWDCVIFASDCTTVEPHDPKRVDSRFLYFQLKSLEPWIQASLARGAAQPHVYPKDLSAIELWFPSLEEQKRIAAILDAADNLRTKRRHALTKLDTLTQAIFHDMFGDPVVNSLGWDSIRAAEVTTKIGSGATPRGGQEAYKDSGVSLIRSMNVHDDEFCWEGLAFIDDAQAAALQGVIVEPEDVLLNITGASVARVCVAPAAILPARVNQHVAIIRPDRDLLHHEFLAALLLSPTMKAKLLRIGGIGATREAITKSEIENLELILPAMELQLAFVERRAQIVEGREAGIRQSGNFDDLFASLQQRAFRGEL